MALLIDSLPAITLDDMRRSLGGRKRLKQLDSKAICLELPDGRSVSVRLTLQPAQLGGKQIFFVCPTCGRRCRTLRITQNGLACYSDLQKRLGAKFASQLPRKFGANAASLKRRIPNGSRPEIPVVQS